MTTTLITGASSGLGAEFARQLARQYVLAQIAVTPLALLSTVLAMSAATTEIDTTGLVYDRVVETVIGAVVGMACVATPWAWRRWVLRTATPARINHP